MLYHLKHPELGIEVRATVLDIPHPNTPYFVGVDLANWLYYSDASHAVKSRVAKNNSFTYKFNEPKCKSRLKLINLQGVKQLIEAANYGRTNPIILPNTQQKLVTWFIDVNEALANPNEMVSLPDVTTTTSATDVTTVFTVERLALQLLLPIPRQIRSNLLVPTLLLQAMQQMIRSHFL